MASPPPAPPASAESRLFHDAAAAKGYLAQAVLPKLSGPESAALTSLANDDAFLKYAVGKNALAGYVDARGKASFNVNALAAAAKSYPDNAALQQAGDALAATYTEAAPSVAVDKPPDVPPASGKNMLMEWILPAVTGIGAYLLSGNITIALFGMLAIAATGLGGKAGDWLSHATGFGAPSVEKTALAGPVPAISSGTPALRRRDTPVPPLPEGIDALVEGRRVMEKQDMLSVLGQEIAKKGDNAVALSVLKDTVQRYSSDEFGKKLPEFARMPGEAEAETKEGFLLFKDDKGNLAVAAGMDRFTRMTPESYQTLFVDKAWTLASDGLKEAEPRRVSDADKTGQVVQLIHHPDWKDNPGAAPPGVAELKEALVKAPSTSLAPGFSATKADSLAAHIPNISAIIPTIPGMDAARKALGW